MSISIKNITISIDGTQSKKFKIEIEGAKYNLDDFKLTQHLLSPNTLTFTMHKNPEEDISEPQFTACSSIIGKTIEINLQTDSIEREISDFSESGQVDDIEFKGIITSASARRTRSEYIIDVEAHSREVLLIDNPNCKSYENMPDRGPDAEKGTLCITMERSGSERMMIQTFTFIRRWPTGTA